MPDQCPHLWIYDHKDYTTLYMRCSRCKAVRTCEPGDELIHPFRVANMVARELNIRHDNVDGDV